MFKSVLLALLPALALAAPSTPRKPCGDGNGLATLNFVGTNTTPASTWKIVDPGNEAEIKAMGINTDNWGADIIDISLTDDKATVQLCLWDDDGDINFGLNLGDKDSFCAFRFGSTTPFETQLFLEVLANKTVACNIADTQITNEGATAAFTINLAK
ncbi:hypothetical protein HDU97_003707 [Phlyctochytrium planicorne]|nr:hypothetical protein HDU97_003707 [Phlyctochytrium planicorne]